MKGNKQKKINKKGSLNDNGQTKVSKYCRLKNYRI